MLAITRSLGDHTLKKYVISEPYLNEQILDEKSEFLILGCDGVWDVLTDQEAVDFVNKCRRENKNLSMELIQEALRKGSQDNISVIVVLL